MKKILITIISVLLTAGLYGATAQKPERVTESKTAITAQNQSRHTVKTPAAPVQPKTQNTARLTAVKPGKNPDKATVTLEVQMDWGDGSGYQLLLDSTLTTYERFAFQAGITESAAQMVTYSDYFCYTLPVDATGRLSDGHWITAGDEPQSLEINPGLYTFFVANPTPGQMIYVASGMGKAAEYYFAAGVEYVFTVAQNGNNDITFLTPAVRDVAAVNPPYRCDFNDVMAYAKQWLVYDADASRDSWRLFTGAHTEDENDYCVGLRTDLDVSPGLPEGLFTSFPVHLAPGDYHISWTARTREWPETFNILVGTEGEFAKMGVLDERINFYSPEGFVQDAVNFTVEEDEEGDYFFGFAAYYTDAFYLFVDNVEIAAGRAVGRPDLRVDAVLEPFSSCGMGSEQDLLVKLSNTGMEPVHKIRVNGKVNDKEFSETLELNLPAMGSVEEVLTLLDLSEPGSYDISFEIEVLTEEGEEAEENTGNNSGHVFVKNWDPENALPFVSDLSGNDPEETADWRYDEAWFYGEILDAFGTGTPNNAIASRCFRLEAETPYVIDLTYRTGYLLAGVQGTASNITVAVGRTGSAMSTWKTAFSQTANTKIFTDALIDFEVDADGTYSVYIYSTTTPVALMGQDGVVFLKNLSLKKVPSYDLRLDGMALPVTIPEKQVNGRYNLPVTLTNRGTQPIGQAMVEIYADGVKVGEGFCEPGGFNNTVTSDVNVFVQGLQVGETAAFRAEGIIYQEADDADPDNNVWSADVVVSEDVLGYDLCTEDMCDGFNLIGHFEYKKMGIPVYVNQTDTLTGITALLGPADIEYTPQAGVYRFDPETFTLGDLVVFDSFRHNPAAGPVTYELPATVLEPGYYFIFIGLHGYRLVCDYGEGEFYTVTGERNLYRQTGFGMPGIRAVFGGGGGRLPEANETVVRAAALKLYPNPARSYIQLVSESGINMESVSIINMNGRVVETAAVNTSSFHYNVSNLSKGLYLAVVKTAQGVQTLKFFIL